MTTDNRNSKIRRVAKFIRADQFPGFYPDIKIVGGGTIVTNGAIGRDSADKLVKVEATDKYMAAATADSEKNVTMRNVDATSRIVSIGATGMPAALIADGVAGAQTSNLNLMDIIPPDMDTTKEVGFRYLWACDAAAVGNRKLTVISMLGTYGPGAFSPGFGADDLDTNIPDETPSGTAGYAQLSGRGKIVANRIPKTAQFLGMSLQFTKAGSNWQASEYAYFMGLLIDYVPRLFRGRRADRDYAFAHLADD